MSKPFHKFLALPLLAVAGGAAAQDSASVEQLDQRIRVLERQLEIQKEEAATKAKDATIASASDKGFSLKKGDYELKFRGVAQVDGRFYLNDGPTSAQPAAPRFNDRFQLRRLRPTLEASLGKLASVRLTPEFAGDGSGLSSSIVDAYIDLKFDPAASIRAGKQKGPVGIERLQSGSAISFVERGLPTELVPNRDLGVALFGELFSSRLSYSIGLFNGTRDGRDIDGNDGDNRHEVAGRLFAEPFKTSPSLLQGLGFGIAGSTGTQKAGTPGSSTLAQLRSSGQNTFFQYAATAQPDGTHTRWSPQAYWYHNNVGVLAEYVASKQDVRNTVSAGTPPVTTISEGSFENTAFEITTTYVLTGEDASYRGVVKPSKPFAKGGGWGAFELKARYGELDVDDDIFTQGFANASSAASKATRFGAGVNWYLTSNVKIALDYNQTQFDGGAAGGQDRLDEKALFTRLQLAY